MNFGISELLECEYPVPKRHYATELARKFDPKTEIDDLPKA